MNTWEKLMKRCLQLAKKGEGKVSPNPMVGCVVVDKTGKIISEGYHSKYGEFHAEREALIKLDNAKNCTLVVNLEPCCHVGKTPPCTDIIIEKGIKRVVYGMKDPNPLVSGKGLKILQKAGIEVVGGILEDECKKLNEVFIKNQTENKIFIAIKTATTIDGKTATKTGNSKWITSEKARREVKNIRKKYDAILTSCATVIADNPTMGHKKKVILDRELKTDLNGKIYQNGEIIVCCDKNLTPVPQTTKNITYLPTPVKNNKLDIEYINKKLYESGIRSILVEAGGILNGSYLKYADKIYHFIAPKILADNSGKSCFDGENTEHIADCRNFVIESTKKFEPDILIIYKSLAE